MVRNIVAALAVGVLMIAFSASVAQATAEENPQPASMRTGIVIGKADKQLTLWTKNGREVFKFGEQTTMPQRKLKDGNLVVVRETSPGSRQAAQIIIVDEQVTVTGKATREYAMIGTTSQGRSPAQVIVRDAGGKEVFVIDPKTFRQPLPRPDQRVAVTYRIENIKPPIYKATGLVVLPAALDESPVKITYSDIPAPEVRVAAAPPPAPAPAPVLTELPQTASPIPLALVIGLLLVAMGIGLRSLR